MVLSKLYSHKFIKMALTNPNYNNIVKEHRHEIMLHNISMS